MEIQRNYRTEGPRAKQNRRETRIVIVGNCDPVAVAAAMREWLVPMLADRFLAEHQQQSPTYRSNGSITANIPRKNLTE